MAKLTRGHSRREPKVVLWVYCEGATEVGWLDDLQRRFRELAVRIERRGEVGVPSTIVETAAEKVKALRRDRLGKRDEVWVVFDRDEHEVAGPLDRARALGIGAVFSNPCFEIWPLLHFTEQSAWIHRHDCQSSLHEHHPEYHHRRNPYVRWPDLEPSVSVAIERSLRLHRRGANAGDILQNPSTTSWMLRVRIAHGEAPEDALIQHLRGARLEPNALLSLASCLAEPIRGRVLAALGL